MRLLNACLAHVPIKTVIVKRHVELNPLRAGMVTDSGEYQWSSYGTKVLGRKDMVVDFHSSYLALVESDGARQKAYTEYVHGTVPENEIKLLKEASQRGQLSGGDRFRTEMERKLGIRLSNKRQGRPRKVDGK